MNVLISYSNFNRGWILLKGGKKLFVSFVFDTKGRASTFLKNKGYVLIPQTRGSWYTPYGKGF